MTGSSIAMIRLVLTIGSTVLCYQLAARKGRNRVLWAAAGLLTIIAVVVIAVLPHARGRDPRLPA